MGKSEIAKIICKTHLDSELLCWEEGHFYTMSCSSGRDYRWIRNQEKPSPFDYDMVAEKIDEFLSGYKGKLKDKVKDQLTKLGSKIPMDNREIVLLCPKPTCQSIEKLDFKQYFNDLRTLSLTYAKPHYLPYLPINDKCCRSTWIYCPRKTVVFPPNTSGEYIHANTVCLGNGLNFISTIYPHDLNRALFWEMVQLKGNSIIDVTNDKDKTSRSLIPYYPSEINQVICFDQLNVTCLNEEQLSPTLFLYRLSLRNLTTNEEKKVDRIHYTGWLDVSGTNEHELLELVKAMQPYLHGTDVPIMHCVGGVGRTGTALTAIALEQLHGSGELCRDNRRDRINEIIIEGRKQRGPEFVQTDTQIETLWNFTDLMIM